MALELAPQDFELLKRVLDRYVSDLRMEIADTDKAEWRKEMHADEDRAKNLLAQLSAAQPEPETQGELRIVIRGFAVAF
jgi:hypothetical protein